MLASISGSAAQGRAKLLLFVVGGFMFSLRIKQEIFPEMDIDKVVVSVPYPGASPEEVETAIVMVIEESIRGLDGVDEVSSTAAEGMGMVVADLLTGADVNVVAQDVKSEIDRITTFPADAEEPQVTIPTLKREVISLLLYGNHSESVMRAAAETVRDQALAWYDNVQAGNENVLLIPWRKNGKNNSAAKRTDEQLAAGVGGALGSNRYTYVVNDGVLFRADRTNQATSYHNDEVQAPSCLCVFLVENPRCKASAVLDSS